MSKYALVKKGFVENVVEWDGKGDLFPEFVCVNVDAITTGPGWSYDGKKFTPPPELDKTLEQWVVEANQHRNALLAQADDVTVYWRAELALGIITDEDKASLILWLTYIKQLQAVDTSTAPEINWPTPPAERAS